MSESKPDTVPGLGFKDKEKATETIKNLEGRDPDYQKLAIKGLIGRAKRVLTLTKDEEKLQNIKDAMKIFDDWLKDFDKNNIAKQNRSYLPLATMQTLAPLVKRHKIEDKEAEKFLEAYEKVKGEYKNLRTVSSKDDAKTWDIVRNEQLKKLEKELGEDADLWDEDLPSKEHMKMIVWGYSPEASKIKKFLGTIKEKLGGSQEQKGEKRKSSGSSSGSSDESPTKKSKK